MKKLLLSSLVLLIGCLNAVALQITSVVPSPQECDSKAKVTWTGGPTSGVQLITFSFARYGEVWRLYNQDHYDANSYTFQYDPSLNPDTITIKMFSSTDESQTPVAQASAEFNNYPYATAQSLYYDYCTSHISLSVTTQRGVSYLNKESMVAELYKSDGTLLDTDTVAGVDQTNMTFNFTNATYNSSEQYYAVTYGCDSVGNAYNVCGKRETATSVVTGGYNLNIISAQPNDKKTAIVVKFQGDDACSAVKVKLFRTDNTGVTVLKNNFTYAGEEYTDSVDVEKCTPYSYQLKAYEVSTGEQISQSNATDHVSLSDHPELGVEFSDVSASLAEYPDKVVLQWSMTNYTNLKQLTVKRSISTNPNQFSIVYTSNSGTANNAFTDNTVSIGTYYLYRIDVVNQDSCRYSSPIVAGFASSTATASGRITYATEMGTPDVQVAAKLSDTSSKFISNGSFAAFGKSVGVVSNNETFSSKALTWQGWIKTSKINKSVFYRQQGMFRIVTEGNNLYVTTDDDAMTSLLSTTIDAAGKFVHVTFTSDADNSALFINGELAVRNSAHLSGIQSDSAFVMAADKNCTYGASGNIDDVRLWSRVLSDTEILRTYKQILAGDEDGLFSYWKFDEQGIPLFVDYAHNTSAGHAGNHGILTGANTYSSDVPEGLHCMAYTDDTGYYKIYGIPFEAAGTTYKIVPYKDGAEFTPTESVVMFDQYNALGQNFNFTDLSSYNVYVHVTYKGTKVPVKGVEIMVDGEIAYEDDNVITTDVEGYASISVPKGIHTISLLKDGHTFSKIDGTQGGQYTGSFHADVEKAYAVELSDSTQVRVAGRVVGGSEEGEKVLTYGLSDNNIGVTEMVLKFKNQDLATCDLIEGGTEESVTTEKKRIESFWIDVPHYSATPANTTTVTKRKNGSVWEWVIKPDAETGEFIVNLYPEEYEVSKIDYFQQPNGGKLDYSASFTPSTDTTGVNFQTYVDSIPVLDYQGEKMGAPDSVVTYVDSVSYIHNFILYNAPVVNVWQENADGGNYFGSKTYKIGDTEVELYTDDGKYTVYHGDPVFIQGNQYSFYIQAAEVYYSAEDVKHPYYFTKGVFHVLNDFGHVNEPFTVTGSGIWKYSFLASQPLFDTGDYRKHLKVFLTSDNVDYYWHPDLGEGNDTCDDYEMPGVNIGYKADPSSQFITKGPDITAFVLRDPPGNQSYASLLTGTTYSYSYSAKDREGEWTLRNCEGSFTESMGMNGDKTIIDALIPIEQYKGDVIYEWDAMAGYAYEWETYDYTTGSYVYTSKISTEITSSTADSVMCSAGDVYVGNSTNIIFSDSRHLDLKLGLEGNPDLYEYNKFDAQDSLSTQFLYTQSYIVNNLIPKYNDLIDNSLIYSPYPETQDDSLLFSMYPDDIEVLYLTKYQKGDEKYGTQGSYTMHVRPGSGKHEDDVLFYIQSIDNWEKTVAANEAVKLDAMSGGAGWKKQNYSFDGGHSLTNSTTFTFSTKEVHTRGFDYSIGLTEDLTYFYRLFQNYQSFDISFASSDGIIEENDYLSEHPLDIDLGTGTDDYPSEESSVSEEESGEITLKYTLADSNPKNTYSVDVYTPEWAEEETLEVETTKGKIDAQAYGLDMPVFILRAGTTSCIHFNGDSTLYQAENKPLNAQTERGQDPKVLVNDMEEQSLSGLDPDAIVPLRVKVSEESSDPANLCYSFYFKSANGAVNINESAYSLNICPTPDKPEYFEIYLEHMRKDVTRDVVSVIAYSQCQHDPVYRGAEQIADTVTVYLEYLPIAPTPAIDYTSSSNVINIDNDSIDLNISGYSSDYQGLTNLVLEYRGEGDVQWQTKCYFALTEEDYEAQKSVYPDKIRLVEGQDSINYTFRFTDADGDGKYLTRVRADIKGNQIILDSKYSSMLELIKDVTAPYVVSVSPSDGIMSIGENIALSTNEDIYVTSIISDKVSITGVLNGQTDKEGNNRALLFNGTDMNAKTDYQYNIYDRSFTVETWVWYDGKSGIIYSQGRTGGDWFELGVTSASNLYISVMYNGKLNTYTLKETLKNNQWTHIAAVYDNELKRVDFLQADAASMEQIDERGFNKNVTPYSGYTQNYNAVGPVYLASDVTGAQYFAGKLRDFRLWNRALKPAEITANSSVLLSGSEIGLVGYWRLNDLEGVTAVDKAQSHSLTHNAAWYLYPGGYAMKTTKADTLLFTSPGLDVEDYTVEFWFKSDDRGNGYMFRRLSDDEFSIEVKNGNIIVNTAMQGKKLTGADYLDGNWHHLALSADHYGDAKLYIDCNLVYSCVSSVVGSMDSKYEMGAGLAMMVDNVRIWPKALDSVALKQNMHKRSAATDDLADYFPFDKMNELNTDLITTSYSIAGAKGKVTVLSDTKQDSTAFFTTDAAMIDAKTNVEEIIPTVIREQRGMTLGLDEFDGKPYRLQDCELSVTVKQEAVKDLHGNYMTSDKQWSVFVDNKRLVWNIDDIELEKGEGEELEFTASFYNRYGQTQSFSIENLPSWLCANTDVGTLSPLATKKVRFTVDPSLPVGDYEEIVYLRGDGDLIDKFTLTLKCRTDAPVWSADCSKTETSTRVIAKVKIDGYYPECEENMLAAFDDGQCVGVANYSADADGLYMLNMCPVSSSDIEYRYWDATTGTLYSKLTPDRVITSGIVGMPSDPVEFSASNDIVAQIPLKAGYNWVSVNVYADSATNIPALFKYDNSVIGIRNQIGEIALRQDSAEWFVTLPEVEPSQMYSVVSSAESVWDVPGVTLDPADVKITVRGTAVQQKWSWIGYTPSVAMSVKEAMSLHTPLHGDAVASKEAFAVYDSIYGWVGTLHSMEPGKGYKYCSSQNTTFVYPSTSATLRSASAGQDEKHFQYDPYLYPNSMFVIAVVNGYTMVEGDEIGWFAGDECRGGATVRQFKDKYLFCGQVYGDSDGKEITAKLFNSTTGNEEQLSNVITFSSDAIIGTLSAPFEYNLGPVSASEATVDGAEMPYKVIIDNQVFIISGDKMYNILGVEQ